MKAVLKKEVSSSIPRLKLLFTPAQEMAVCNPPINPQKKKKKMDWSEAETTWRKLEPVLNGGRENGVGR